MGIVINATQNIYQNPPGMTYTGTRSGSNAPRLYKQVAQAAIQGKESLDATHAPPPYQPPPPNGRGVPPIQRGGLGYTQQAATPNRLTAAVSRSALDLGPNIPANPSKLWSPIAQTGSLFAGGTGPWPGNPYLLLPPVGSYSVPIGQPQARLRVLQGRLGALFSAIKANTPILNQGGR